MSPATTVSTQRLWQRHMEMAAIGGFGKTGVNRQAFSNEDIRARQLLASLVKLLKLHIFVDPVDNLFFRYQPPNVKGGPIMTGSHADSQPTHVPPVSRRRLIISRFSFRRRSLMLCKNRLRGSTCLA